MEQIQEDAVLSVLRSTSENTPIDFFLGNKKHATLISGVGEGDDCAVYDFEGEFSFVASSDFVRGPGFKLFQAALLSYEDLGFYLVVANLSDIAAMGAKPIGFTTVLRWGPNLTRDNFEAIIRGVQSAAHLYQTPLVGGDVGSYEETVLSGTVFGMTEKNSSLRRRGAKVGDGLYLIGDAIGLANAALTYFLKAKPDGFQLSTREENILLDSWKKPVPRIREGLLLHSLSGNVHSCQDVSDGTNATLEQLASASGVSVQLIKQNIPVHSSIEKIARYLNIDPLMIAFGPSVDFNLLISMDRQAESELRRRLGKTNVFHIGNVIDGSIPSHLVDKNQSLPIPGIAWKQQTDITKTMLGES